MGELRGGRRSGGGGGGSRGRREGGEGDQGHRQAEGEGGETGGDSETHGGPSGGRGSGGPKILMPMPNDTMSDKKVSYQPPASSRLRRRGAATRARVAQLPEQ